MLPEHSKLLRASGDQGEKTGAMEDSILTDTKVLFRTVQMKNGLSNDVDEYLLGKVVPEMQRRLQHHHVAESSYGLQTPREVSSFESAMYKDENDWLNKKLNN
jgi:hypothetical protein